MTEPTPIQIGNTKTDAVKGWIVGSSIPENQGLRRSEDVEIKWSAHQAGEERAEWVTGEIRTTIAILISGRFQTIFRDRTVTLAKPGDFVMWGKGNDHTYRVLDDAVILTVRWPSIKPRESA